MTATLHVVLIALAVFTCWEWFLALPVALPATVQPVAVVGLCYGAQRLPQVWLLSLACAGLVALLHNAVRQRIEPPALPLRRHPATGRRVPDLP